MAIAKVLLVDDDEIVRFGLAELLEDKGFDITAAASVPEALKHISSETYDVLLSDQAEAGKWTSWSSRGGKCGYDS